jgi:GH25 family lysozyme M1 (1,4-beta-N-acetylmuramidase)
MRAKGSNCVIDISHHNGAGLRFDKAKSDGILGVIQKATQGKTYVDATFKKNKKAILAEGLLLKRLSLRRWFGWQNAGETFLERCAAR